MKYRVPHKIITLLLSVFILSLMFACLTAVVAPMSVSAAGTTPERVTFKGVNYTCFKYTKSWATIKAGNYKFVMDCKIFKGTPLVIVGNDEVGTTISGYQTNRVGTYDPVNYKYTFTFTITANWGGNLGVQIGNNSDYGGSGDAYFMCANPALYLLDESGEPTGSSLINTLAADYYSSSRAGNKWNKRNEASSTMLRTTDNVTHAFDPDSAGTHMAYFPAGSDSYQVLAYKDNNIFLPAGKYRVTLDVNNRSSATGTIQLRSGSDIATTYSGTKISEDGYTQVWEFTVSSNVNGIGIFIGNYGKGEDLDVVYKNIRCNIYENGEIVGANLFSPLNSSNYDWHDWTGSRSNAVNGKWTPINCNSSLITVSTIDNSYFPVSDPAQMIHFPAKCADNYQVLCYKGGAIESGTYRFTVDECAVGGIKSDVLLNVNSGNATSGYAGAADVNSDVLSGINRTVEFRLWSNKSNFIIMIGNRGKGSEMDTYFKNPALYKVVGGEITGSNLIADFKVSNIELKTETSKDSISIGKWTSINWKNGYIVAEDVDDDKFTPVYRDGDYNNDNTTDIIDLVSYKNVRCGNKVTLQSLDCDEDGTVDHKDFKELINTILGRNVYTLKNTRYKLEAGDTVNVAYIGGSVTGGTGSTDASLYSWRARTTAWLKSKYPSATVNEINMGIGGTGSYLGAARFNNNIVNKNPDLVFVEFAVNDGYNSISTEQTKQDIEYMIRCLNDNHPYCDMVFVMVTDRYKLGTQFTKLREIKEVADYYGIPIIDVGAAMNETLGGSTDNWDTYFTDMVHPNDDGYAVYANGIASGLEKLMANGGYSKHKLKNVKLSLYTPDYVNLLTRDTYDPFKWGKLDSDWGANYWFSSNDYEISGTPFRTSYSSCLSEIFSKYIYPLSDGANLTFTVKGTSIGILGNIKENQTLTVNIDGTNYVLSGSNTTNTTEYPVKSDLPNVNHTVTITANGSGPYVAIAAVVVGS